MSENSARLLFVEFRGPNVAEALAEVGKMIAPTAVMLGSINGHQINGHELPAGQPGLRLEGAMPETEGDNQPPKKRKQRRGGRPRKVREVAAPPSSPSPAANDASDANLPPGKKQKVADQMEALIRKYGPLRAEELATQIGISANGVKRSIGHNKNRFWMDEDQKFHVG